MPSDRPKYPRTPHLPFSPGVDEDDIVLDTGNHFEEREVVVLEKRDGENFTLAPSYCHARSVDSRHHPSRSWIKQRHREIKHHIPEGWRVCGEYLFAEHSIRYTELDSYFEVFSIWDDDNEALSWDETKEWCDLIGLEHVPVLWRGTWDRDRVQAIFHDLDTNRREDGSMIDPEGDVNVQEGIVVRTADGFHYDGFQDHLAKAVRPNHVTTSDHWRYQEIVPNELA